MTTANQGGSVPASQSVVSSGGQTVHSGSELAAAGVTSPGVAGAPATGASATGTYNMSDVFSRLMEAMTPQGVPQVETPGISVDRAQATSPVPRMSRSFTLTPHQRNVLGGFMTDETAMRDQLLKAIGSNDASLGPYTPEQMQAYRTQASARNVQGGKAQVSSFKSIIGKVLEGYKVS